MFEFPKKEDSLDDRINKAGNLLTIDGKGFDITKLSKLSQSHLGSLKFVSEQILQKNNELQIADSARIVYLSSLKEELSKTK